MTRFQPSRRSFLTGAGAFGALTLAGCSVDSVSGDVDLGGADRVRILNWADYVDPDEDGALGTVSRVEQDLQIFVDYGPSYDDNTSAWEQVIEPSLSAGNPTGYDIIVPTNWLAGQMASLGWLQEIPIEIIPNHVNIEPQFLTPAWDRGARLNMPWQAGITGIAYDPAATGRDIEAIADLFDPELRGRVSMVVEMRESVGFAMLAAGDDPSRPTADAAHTTLDTIEAATESGQITSFTANEFADGLASGELAAAMAWSGDIVQLQRERPDIRFVIPRDGAISWFDTMVIPRGATNLAAAGAWMNYVYEPANAALITSWVQYISPVIGVRDELVALGGESAELAESPILFPDDDTKRRLFTWGGLANEVEAELDARFSQIAGL